MGGGGKLSFAESLQANQLAGRFICMGVDDIPTTPRIENIDDVMECTEARMQRIEKVVVACAHEIAALKFSFAGWIGEPHLIHGIFKRIHHVTERKIPIILDAKWGDVEHTMEKFAKQTFDAYDADAVTLNPYLGLETLKPFLKERYADRGVFVLCKTSNPNSGEFQDSRLQDGSTKVWERVALQTQKLQRETGRSIGLVFGATHPAEIKDARVYDKITLQLLLPGIGKQGGDLEKTITNALLPDGTGPLINVSRSFWEDIPDNNDDAAKTILTRVKDLNTQISTTALRKKEEK